MTRERYVTLGLMLLASFVGGASANLLMTARVEAQAGAETVTTNQVNLVDDGGNLRAVLASRDERGLASLTFYDDAGRPRGLVGIEADGTPVVRLSDAGGQARLLAMVRGNDAVVVAGPEGSTQVLIGSIQGNPMITLGDGARSRMQLHLTPAGFPRMALADANGEEAVALTVGSDEMPQLMLSAGGRPRALMTVAQNAALLNLFDESRTRLIVGVAENGFPSVSFFDETGEIISQVPQ